MTIGEAYNAKVMQIMPGMRHDLLVHREVDNAGQIDSIVFRRSEYLGGMAAVLLALVADERADAATHVETA